MAVTSHPSFLRVAVDTNFLIDLANGKELCGRSLERLQANHPAVDVVVLPTVLQELTHLKLAATSPEVRRLAESALASIRRWKMTVQSLGPVWHGVADEIGSTIRRKGLLPPEERNDGLIIAEAALGQCDFLISSDGHYKDMDQVALRRILSEDHDVKETAIVTPSMVARLL